MYECSSWLGFEANAKWKVVEAATANNTQLHQLVNDDCASNVLRVWAPTGGSGCELAFPGDPAGGACSGDPCVPIAGSVPSICGNSPSSRQAGAALHQHSPCWSLWFSAPRLLLGRGDLRSVGCNRCPVLYSQRYSYPGRRHGLFGA